MERLRILVRQPKDNYMSSFMRVILHVCGVLSLFVGIAVLALRSAALGQNELPFLNGIRFAIGLLLAVIGVAMNILGRKLRDPAAGVSMCLHGVELSLILVAIFSPHSSLVEVISAVIMIAVIAADLSRGIFHIFLLLTGFCISAYNDAVVDGGHPSFALMPSSAAMEQPSVWQEIGAKVVGLLVTIAVALITSWIGSQTAETSTNRVKEFALAQRLVDLWVKYDTNQVQQELERAQNEMEMGGDAAGGDMLRTFYQMNKALERYKPHLPNYVLRSTTMSPTGAGHLGEIEALAIHMSPHGSQLHPGGGQMMGDSVVLSGFESREMTPRKGGNGNEEPEMPLSKADTEVGDDQLSSISSWHQSGSIAPSDLNNERSNNTSLSAFERPNPLRRNDLFAASESELNSPDLVPLQTSTVEDFENTRQAYQGITSAAIITFGGGTHSPAVLDTLASKLYRLADETQAVVHVVLGDEMHLSWNTAFRCAAPEAKATLFLARVKAELPKEDSLQTTLISGVVCSGAGTSYFARTTDRTILTVQLPWRSRLRALQKLAKRHSTFLVDAPTYSHASHAAAMHAVDVLTPSEDLWLDRPTGGGLLSVSRRSSVPTHNSSGNALNRSLSHSGSGGSLKATTASEKMLVFEVAEERTTLPSIEWMYTVQQQELDVHSKVTECLKSFFAGDGVAAAQFMDEIPNSIKIEQPLVYRLYQAVCDTPTPTNATTGGPIGGGLSLTVLPQNASGPFLLSSNTFAGGSPALSQHQGDTQSSPSLGPSPAPSPSHFQQHGPTAEPLVLPP